MLERRQGLLAVCDHVGGVTEILQQQEHNVLIYFVVLCHQDAGIMNWVWRRFARQMVFCFRNLAVDGVVICQWHTFGWKRFPIGCLSAARASLPFATMSAV